MVEIVGTAGAGKTTLLRALSQHKEIATRVHLRKADYLPFLLSDAPLLLPTLFTRPLGGRWFTWSEIRSMAYLRAWYQALERAPHSMITCLDLGPVFRLARLREFGPEPSKRPRFQRWSAGVLAQWAARLTLIIWLDAPDAILVKRINTRDQAHLLKGKAEREALEFLVRFRASFEEVIADMTAKGGPRLLRINTHEKPLDDVVDNVMATLNTLPHDG